MTSAGEAAVDAAAEPTVVLGSAEAPPAARNEEQAVKIEDLEKKLEENPFMKDPEDLNSIADKVIESVGALYRTFEIVQQGAVPIELVVSSVATTVDNFRLLKTELHDFQKHGKITFEEIELEFGEIVELCSAVSAYVQSGSSTPEEVVERLNDIIALVESFLALVSKKMKELQSLRKGTADTWLASTSVASIAVGGAAAVLCALTGGAALPVLAPLIAFGAGTTAVATASHVAFNPNLGANIRDMDEQVKKLDVLKMKAGIVARKAEKNKKIVEEAKTKKHWWQM